MQDRAETGHDGPYEAPILVTDLKVLPEWIDYNGHMNVAFYTLAVDNALDVVLETELGIGASFVKAAKMGPYSLQAHYGYLAELREGEGFSVSFRLLDHDAKRLHLYLELIRDTDSAVAATVETLLMNVDHQTRRSAAYPDWAVARFDRMKADHDALPQPNAVGARVGIRRP